MKIDGKEAGFLYSIGADCDIDDELQKIGAQDFAGMIERLGTTKSYVKMAVILNKWWSMQHGTDPITEKDLMLLNAGNLETLQNAVLKAFQDGRKAGIKTQPVKGKNAESAAKSN